MSLIPTVYRSTDPGAPVLSGTAGSFAALMDAVLVNGYGTGPDAKPGLGWVRAFSDGHKRAYQNSLADGGTGMFWRIDDSNAQYVLNSAFHTMSDIDNGVDPFGHTSNAWSKSVSANTIARFWTVVGNGRSVYLIIENGSTLNTFLRDSLYFAGDYGCLKKDYPFNFGIVRTGLATTSTSSFATPILHASASGGSYLAGARDFSGLSVDAQYRTRQSLINRMTTLGGVGVSGGSAYPYPPTGGILATPVCIDLSGSFFGYYPGLYAPEHSGVLTKRQEYTLVHGLPGMCLAVESQLGQGLLLLDKEWSY